MARLRGTRWQADALHNGKRVRRSFETKEAAEAWENQVKTASTKGQAIPTSGGTTSNTLRGYYHTHGMDIWADAKRPEVQSRNIDVLCRYIGENVALSDINETALDNLISLERRDGKSNATINRHISTLKKLLRHAYRRGIIGRLPDSSGLKEGSGKLRFFSEDEFAAIEEAYSSRGFLWDLRYIYVLLYTATRFSEPLMSKREHIQQDHLYLRPEITKGNRERRIPIRNEKAVDAVGAFLRDNNQIHPFESRIEYKRFLYRWKLMMPHAGIHDNPTPHVLRHTAASWMVQRGVDIYRVRDFLGHADLASTQIYAKLNPAALEAAADIL